MFKRCHQCSAHKKVDEYSEYSLRCKTCEAKPTYHELEANLKVAVELLEEFDRIGECSLRKTREALEKIKAK